MFETIEDRRSLVGPFVIQLLLVPIVVGALSLPLVLLYDRFVRSVVSANALRAWDAAGITVFLAVGVLVGRFLAAPREVTVRSRCRPPGSSTMSTGGSTA